MSIRIIADSTCDLSKELIAKYNIRIVPLIISMGSEMLKDGIEITPEIIFDYIGSGKGMCRTSAVNTAEYADIYKEERLEHDAVIHFVVSSKMSACYQNALIAAQDFTNVYVIDSLNLSTAIGHLVLDAAEMAEQGIAAAEIANEINRRVKLLDASFIIDTLAYLHKGGRCTAIQALASSVLSIKPCIIVRDGEMTVGKKYRGKLEMVLRKYVEDKLSDIKNIDTRRIFVTHTMAEQNYCIVETVKLLLTETFNFEKIYETKAGSTISCHCGPNTLGILFYRKNIK